MVKYTCRHIDGLRCEALHEPSGVRVVTDGDHKDGGADVLSPTDLVAAALGNCMLTIAAIVAQREEIDISALRIEIEQEMAGPPKRRIGRLNVTVRMPTGLTDRQRRKLEAGIQTCPVHHSLSEEMERPVVFAYSDGD